jgi:hypothetical protein
MNHNAYVTYSVSTFGAVRYTTSPCNAVELLSFFDNRRAASPTVLGAVNAITAIRWTVRTCDTLQ